MPNDAAFGSGDPDPMPNATMTVEQLADAIRAINVQRIHPGKLDDVIEIVEHLREQTLELHHETIAAAEELHKRELQLRERERELAIRKRAVDAVLKGKKVVTWRFWT